MLAVFTSLTRWALAAALAATLTCNCAHLQRLYEYSASAEQRGLRVIIAGAGGAAHLPGCACTARAV